MFKEFFSDLGFGLTYVKQENNQIIIGGINTADLLIDIQKIWKNSKVLSFMFSKVTKHQVTFNPFFAIDVLYILQQISLYKKRKSSKYRIDKAIDLIKTETWVRSVYTPHKDILDISQLKQMFHQPYEHQMRAILDYNLKLPKMGLNGFLLAIDPGGGKTITSLGISTCLKAEIVVVVVLKTLVETVWVDGIKEEFGNDTPVWTPMSNESLSSSYKYYVVNYEAIQRLMGMISFFRTKKVTIILDESHNLNDPNSLRSQKFTNLCQLTNCKNIIFSSGTPIRQIGAETITILRCIDPLFNKDAEDRFRKIYGISAKRANDVLRHRIDLLSHKIPRSAFMTIKPPIVIKVKVKIKDGDRYTVRNIRKEMRMYMEERWKYHNTRMRGYLDVYEQCINTYAKTIKTKSDQEAFDKYQIFMRTIRNNYVPKDHKELVKYCNIFDKTKVLPSLSPQQRRKFKEVISAIRYVGVKIVGEALGNVLMRRQADCHSEMVSYLDLEKVIETADKKTIIFSDTTKVLETVGEYVKKKGFLPNFVYGDYLKNSTKILDDFVNDPTINPLVATYKSLSAGANLTVANIVYLIGLPPRSYIYDQAISRAFRMKQDSQVYIYEAVLDTGSELNISTRIEDIMNWSREMTSEILGTNITNAKMDSIVFRLHMNPETKMEKIFHIFQDILKF